jgi:hypothetical protein
MDVPLDIGVYERTLIVEPREDPVPFGSAAEEVGGEALHGG